MPTTNDDGDLDPEALAALVLTAKMVNVTSALRWAWVRLFVTAVGALFDIDRDAKSPVLGDLAVVRRDTGATVLRVDDADAETLAYVRRQLEELTVAEFLDRWNVQL